MERSKIVLEFMKSLAPVFAEQGSALIKQLADAGHDPSKCTSGGMDLLHAYSKSAREWAEAMADEYEKEIKS